MDDVSITIPGISRYCSSWKVFMEVHVFLFGQTLWLRTVTIRYREVLRTCRDIVTASA
jgi:hypothetical protein